MIASPSPTSKRPDQAAENHFATSISDHGVGHIRFLMGQLATNRDIARWQVARHPWLTPAPWAILSAHVSIAALDSLQRFDAA